MPRLFYVLLLATFFSCKKQDEKPTGDTANTKNDLPIAIAGPDMTITLPDTSQIYLDGTRSYDPEKTNLWLDWVQLSGPPIVMIQFDHTKAGDALLRFGKSGRYQFQLTVKDNVHTVFDTVEITVRWADECNTNREFVSADLMSLGFSPSIIAPGASWALSHGQLVIAGGLFSTEFDFQGTFSSSIHYYDMKSNAWSKWDMLPRSSYWIDMSAVIADNKLFLGGGFVDPIIPTDEVEIHDLATKKIIAAKLSMPRAGLTAATVGNKVVFAGGYTEVVATNAVDIFDISTNSWSTAKLSEPRMGMSVMVNGSKIYFVGGRQSIYSDVGISNTVDIYDAITGSWSVQHLTYPGNHLMTVSFGNKMVVSGNLFGPNTVLPNRVEFIDLSSWSSKVDCALFGPYYSRGPLQETMSSAVIGDNIYFANHESISMYDSVNKLWKHAMANIDGGLFAFQGELYGLIHPAGGGQVEVIRIRL